jgi:hypothetical protein
MAISPDRLMVLEFSSSGIMSENVHDVLSRMGAYIVDENEHKDDEGQTHYTYTVQFPEKDSLEVMQGEIVPYKNEDDETTALPHGKRRDFFDSLQTVRPLSAADRMGPRLTQEGFPSESPFFLDIDLWRPETQEDVSEAERIIRKVCAQNDGRLTDRVLTNSLLLLRVYVDPETARKILNLDIVALVDLPPRIDASIARIFNPDTIPDQLPEPTDAAPSVCVVDSGVDSGHPFLKGWVVSGRDFNTGENTSADQNGHGTKVSGLAVYGDVWECLRRGEFTPRVKIHNAKVLRNDGNGHPTFPQNVRVEGVIAEALEHFATKWGCKVFNLSIGDRNAVYSGGRQFQWAEKIDEIARSLDIVVVISAGNRVAPPIPSGSTREDWRESLKDTLLSPEQRICSPATAALAVTVGAISRNNAVLIEDDDRSVPDAIHASPNHAPAPFSRTGPGYSLHTQSAAVKPDFVHYGGNYALHTIAGTAPRWNRNHYLTGEPTTVLDTHGRFLGTAKGTSLATPRISHIAALSERAAEELTGQPPSANLIRALMGSTSVCPDGETDWLNDEEEMLNLVGYGICDEQETEFSARNRVHIVASDEIELDQLHVYKIPLPDSFLQERGKRGVTASLAFDPPVRASRKEYTARTMQFELLHGLTNDEVAQYMASQENEEPRLPSKNRLDLRPPKTRVQWSTLQVRRKSWQRRPTIRANTEGGSPILHLMVLCQSRFPTPLEPSRQSYSIAVKFWHENMTVDIYQKIRNEARITQRVRTRETIRIRS